MRILGHWKLRRFAACNQVVGWPSAISGYLRIEAAHGNRIVFEEGVTLRNISLSFGHSGNTLIFRAGTNPTGRFIMNGGATIEIGKATRFHKSVWLQAHEGRSITIGRDCLLADVRIRTSDIHKILDSRTKRRLNYAADVNISDHVWLAEGVSIYKGASIGENSVIGAHAVVTRSIPSNCVAVGCPAEVIRRNIIWKP